jgi:molecular chaperone DnaJ
MVHVDFEKDYYAILGLENTATLEEIKKAYRVLAKQYHPDVNKAPNATEIFNAISEAYEILSDERQRDEYDGHSVHGAPKQNRASARAAANGGISRGRGDAAGHASPIDARLERTLLLSLIVPGVFQIASGDRKSGGLMLAGYVIFWALAILYSVEIGVLAVLVWAIAILDSYNTFRKRTWEGSEPAR